MRTMSFLAQTNRERQFDPQYQSYFYINPTTNPPTTSWTHPNAEPGQAHPEQAGVFQAANQSQGGGEAAQYMNAGNTQPPVANAQQYPNSGEQEGQDGERGLGSMLGGMMGGGNQYQQQQSGYGGFGTGMLAGGGAGVGAMLLKEFLGGVSPG